MKTKKAEMRLDDFYIVLVTGTRDWEDAAKLQPRLKRALMGLKTVHGRKLLVISGEADGIDTLTRTICKAEGIWFVGVPAPWKLLHNGAGPKRNTFMLDIFNPDFVLAWHPEIEKSKGTRNCVEQAQERRIPIGLNGERLKYISPSARN